MKYKVTHNTTYVYSSPVSVCHNIVILAPRNSGRLRCQSHRLVIRPTPLVSTRRQDFFGNINNCFSIEELHKSLSITITSNVEVASDERYSNQPDLSWEFVRDGMRGRTDANWMSSAPFQFASTRVPLGSEYGDYAAGSFPAGGGILAGLSDLTRRIHSDFTYDSVATHVDTSVEEVFKNRRGVCQDFAHLQLTLLRSLGIPARYMSGYLRTIPPEDGSALVGADQSHAWLAAYCGPDLGWVEFDPTNDCRCSLDHIPIAWGRDYSDVVPVRGVFLGGGNHQLSVSVKVESQETGSQQQSQQQSSG